MLSVSSYANIISAFSPDFTVFFSTAYFMPSEPSINDVSASPLAAR